jgi:arabinofuranosyltransferase
MTSRRPPVRASAAIGFVILGVQLLRTAWLSDDAYITFRSADNIVNGLGPVWNAAERVQGFTHPLWLGLFTLFYGLTREAYYTAIALSIAVTFTAVELIRRHLALSPWSLLVAFAALLSSKAFIDFSTSGLENPLSHLLVVGFLWCWWRHSPGPARLMWLTGLASLCMLTRIDLGLLVGPAIAVEFIRLGPRASWRPVAIGLAPLAAWEVFSIFYYASLVPNTAYAKLNVGMSTGEAVSRGINYVMRTVNGDPATLPVMILAMVATLRTDVRNWPLIAGLAASLGYVLWIGGDFMMGRFFTVPLVWCAALLAASSSFATRRASIVATALITVLGLSAPWEPALVSGIGYARVDNLVRGRTETEPSDGGLNVTIREITDERRYYYEGTGLLKGRLGDRRPDHPMVDDGAALRAGGPTVVVRDGIGFTGYFAGPQVHIVDVYALTDPLLARLPAIPGSRTGHYRRDIPAGYLESLRAGANLIVDPDLAEYYAHLRFAVSGPLFSADRIVTAVNLVLGRDNRRLQQYLDNSRPPAPAEATR